MAVRRSPSSILARIGTVTLVAGARADIDAGCLTAPDKCTIILSRNTPGGTPGFLSAPVSGRGALDTTFDIASSDALDTSTVNWMAIPNNVGLTPPADFDNIGSLRKPPSGKFLVRGLAVMVGGTVTVTTGHVFTAEARVYLLAHDQSGAAGFLSAPGASVNPATGQFVINSTQGADAASVDYVIVDEPIRFSPSGVRMSQGKGILDAGVGVFENMNPLNQEDISVLASFIALSTPGQLRCDAAGRAPTVTNGDITIESSEAGDVSTIEMIIF